MNIVLDVNIVVDICARRRPYYDDSLGAVVLASVKGHRIWLYVGAVQTMEYVLGDELKRSRQVEAVPISHGAYGRQARELLHEFALDKHWLAALAGEGDVLLARKIRSTGAGGAGHEMHIEGRLKRMETLSFYGHW